MSSASSVAQVTHPEITAENALGALSLSLFALVAFLARAIADLALDACGAVLPAVCGSRAERLGGVAVAGAGVSEPAEGSTDGEGGGDDSGVVAAAAAAGLDIGGDGDAGGPAEDGNPAEGGHELDRYFVL